MKIAFLVPAYNEAATIGDVLERIDALGVERQIVVVDDGSSDDTAAIVARLRGGARRRGAAGEAQRRQGLGAAGRDPVGGRRRGRSSRTPTWSTTPPRSRT